MQEKMSKSEHIDVETQPLSAAVHGLRTKRLDIEAAMWCMVWMLMSSCVVFYNKWLFESGGFPYPLALTAMHMTCCFILFGAIRQFAPDAIRLNIMPDATVDIPWSVYVRQCLGIGALYACTLGLGNVSYLYASVAFIQMMKPINIIFASLAAFVLGVEPVTFSHLIIVCIIFFGVSVSSNHATDFSVMAFALQMASSLCEGSRLALIQLVTTSGLKLDPVTTVYHFSLASSVLLWCACAVREWPLDFSKLYSPWVLISNCLAAVVLNVLIAMVIKKTSAVVFALSGVIKDLGVIAASAFILYTPITGLSVLGYTMSVAGVCMYKAYRDNLAVFKERGFLRGMKYSVVERRMGPA
jgi:hypothetical protein